MKINSIFSGLKDKICVFYKKNKKIFFACVICFVVLIILILSTFSDISKKKKISLAENTSVSVTEYASGIENKLKAMLIGLKDVSSVSVFVMVESTPKVTYLTETNEKTQTKDGTSISEISTTVIFEKNGSINTPVVITTLMPKITGVLVVVNKISASTKLSIVNSISVVLNIDDSCISILQDS